MADAQSSERLHTLTSMRRRYRRRVKHRKGLREKNRAATLQNGTISLCVFKQTIEFDNVKKTTTCALYSFFTHTSRSV